MRKHLDQHGIEGQRPSLEDHRTFDVQALGQAADGLFGNGMERGQGQILLGYSLIQERLYICLSLYTTPAGHSGPFSRHFVESLDRHI